MRKGALAAGAAGAIMAGVSAAGSVGAATYFARRVVTPDPRRPDDTEILAVGEDCVTLGLTAETAVRGRYGLWLDGGEGHARVGEVLDVDRERGRVTRRLEGVDSGRLTVGFARWNQYYYAGSPREAFGLDTHDVRVRSELGDLPAWLVPGEASAAGARHRWADPRARPRSTPGGVPACRPRHSPARLHGADSHVPQRHRCAAQPGRTVQPGAVRVA